MTRFSTQRFSPRARPWLVLWLLPYLVMSVAAAVHHHGFGAASPSLHSSLATQSCDAISSDAISGDAISSVNSVPVAHSDATHDLLCLACHWANWASAMLAASPSVFVSIAATIVFAALLQAPTRRAFARAAIRGPPSL